MRIPNFTGKMHLYFSRPYINFFICLYCTTIYYINSMIPYIFILSPGVGSVIVIMFYVLGMGYKLYKIWKGEYVEEEPVFLKYK